MKMPMSVSESRKFVNLRVPEPAYALYRLKLIREFSGGTVDELDERINGRARVAEQFATQTAKDGTIAVYVWQRDCDCVEWDYVTWIAPTPEALRKLENDLHKGAEGPVHMSVMDLQEAAEYEPSRRDRILEAHENGHPWSV